MEDGKKQAAATQGDTTVASTRKAAVLAFRKLTADVKDPATDAVVQRGMSNRIAARKIGYPYHTIYMWGRLYDKHGFDGLLPKHKNSGRKRSLNLTHSETEAIRANKLLCNTSKNGGSTTLAVLKTDEDKPFVEPVSNSVALVAMDGGTLVVNQTFTRSLVLIV